MSGAYQTRDVNARRRELVLAAVSKDPDVTTAQLVERTGSAVTAIRTWLHAEGYRGQPDGTWRRAK